MDSNENETMMTTTTMTMTMMTTPMTMMTMMMMMMMIPNIDYRLLSAKYFGWGWSLETVSACHLSLPLKR